MCIVVIAEIKIWDSIYAKSCNVCGKLGRSGQMGIKLREQSPDSGSDDAEYWVRFPLWVSPWILIYIHAGIDISWFLLLHIQYKSPHPLCISCVFLYPNVFFSFLIPFFFLAIFSSFILDLTYYYSVSHVTIWFIWNWLCLEECQFHATWLLFCVHSWTLLVIHHYGSPTTNNFLAFVAGLGWTGVTYFLRNKIIIPN